MYLDDIAGKIRAYIPDDRMPEGDADALFRIYAVLLRAKGGDVTRSDIHDAWSAWMAKGGGGHASLVPYEDCRRSGPSDRAAESLNLKSASGPTDNRFVGAQRRFSNSTMRRSRPGFGLLSANFQARL